MKITIVIGFFLPVPPVAGGALEKMWWRLARVYARRGHQVTLISRQWPEWPKDEWIDGVHLLRVAGMNHRRSLWQNLLLDAIWGWRVKRVLPEADILITNTIALPVYIRKWKRDAGVLIVNLNRFPKGQIRWYGDAARIQAASSTIADAAIRQAPALTDRIRCVPNAIDITRFLSNSIRSKKEGPLTIGFIGRIHPEKGLHTLMQAMVLLSQETALPPWQLLLRGPVDVPRGGGGEEFLDSLKSAAPVLWSDKYVRLAPAIYDDDALVEAYHELDIFCYPTQAYEGEAHPVAVLEAMATGLPVVVSDLPVFRDQIKTGQNALIVASGDAGKLAEALKKLLLDQELRQRLGLNAIGAVKCLDDETIASQHLADYASLLPQRT